MIRGLAVGLLALLSGCQGDESPETLHVFAASALTDAFREMERRFESASERVDVSLSFAGSQVLRLQIEQGAPADVYASGDRSHMDALVEGGWVQQSRVFAHNELVLIVPPDNPAGIESVGDLVRARRVVIGAESSPVGIYTRELFRKTGIRPRVVSEETNVRLVRAKVEMGEADAAIVYVTDAASSDRVRAVAIPPERNVRADFYIGIVEGADHPELAGRWIGYVRSDAGREVLARHGFGAAP
jgi:molybdate transport system substrate-binding protein